ncbi:MAG: AraC family transcriptional regulator ligand-binding domain-containing protein [Pseudomonadota bacterium]
MNSGRISAAYARGLLDYLRTRGVDPCVLYPRALVAAVEQGKGPAEIPLPEWIAMFPPAIRALDEHDLPVKAGASLRLRHLGALGHVLMSCATLAEVALQLRRYIRLLGQIGEPALSVENDSAHLLWLWPYETPADPAIAQFMLGARAMFMRWLANRHDLLLDAHFHFARPRDTGGFEREFGGRLLFDQPQSKLVFPAKYLDLPVVSADEALHAQAEIQAQALLSELRGESELLDRLKTVLVRGLANGRVGLENAASGLGLSVRTLQRRLAEHDRSFQDVLDEVRRAQAERLLRTPHVPLTQIAFLLGYSEQSSFHEAFRRWTGVAPGAWREGILHQEAGSTSQEPRRRAAPAV